MSDLETCSNNLLTSDENPRHDGLDGLETSHPEGVHPDVDVPAVEVGLQGALGSHEATDDVLGCGEVEEGGGGEQEAEDEVLHGDGEGPRAEGEAAAGQLAAEGRGLGRERACMSFVGLIRRVFTSEHVRRSKVRLCDHGKSNPQL